MFFKSVSNHHLKQVITVDIIISKVAIMCLLIGLQQSLLFNPEESSNKSSWGAFYKKTHTKHHQTQLFFFFKFWKTKTEELFGLKETKED